LIFFFFFFFFFFFVSSDLEGAVIAREDKGAKFRLSIRTNKGRTYVITAPDVPIRDSWFDAFTKARDSAQRPEELKVI
jgi:hypothetical protein